MLKVLLVLENDIHNTGGIERHCANIIDLFKEDSSIRIDYLCSEKISFKYNRLLQKKTWNIRQLEIIMADYNVIHIHGFASYIVGQALNIATKLGKKIIYTPHFHPFNMLRRPLYGKIFFNLYIHKYLNKINTIISINNEDKSFFDKYSDNVVLIPHWLTGIEIVETKKASNIILAVGRNDENKGLFHLNYIPKDLYEVHCVTNNSKGLDSRIKFHINVSDKELNLLYSKASLLVVPSLYEAFSYVALEALERGVPLLISERVRIYDHIKNISGVEVFKYGNSAEFVSKIKPAINATVDTTYIEQYFAAERIQAILKKIYCG